MPKRFLFVCVANSFRSQIAEGWARHLADPHQAVVRSGGTMAAGVVHPRAIRAMREVGIDISRQTSKPIDVAFADRADAFVTLCGPVDGACPARVAKKAIDWPTADPTWGDDEEVRRVRDAIGLRVEELLREHGVLRQDTAHPA